MAKDRGKRGYDTVIRFGGVFRCCVQTFSGFHNGRLPRLVDVVAASGFCAAGGTAPPKRSAKAASVLRLLEAVHLPGRGARVLSGRMAVPSRAAHIVVPGQMTVPRRARPASHEAGRRFGGCHRAVIHFTSIITNTITVKGR